jgi:hypothetical protein
VTKTTAQEIAGLKLEVQQLQKTLGTLIKWMAESANSPIRGDEAYTLIKMIAGVD